MSPEEKGRMKKRLILIFLMVIFSSCAPKEIERMFDLTLEPFKTQGKIYSKVFDLDKATTYQKTIDVLQSMRAIVYRRDPKKNFLVALNFERIYVHCNKTTEVAVFFSDQGSNKTKVEVSCLNYHLAKVAADSLFKELS